MKGSVYPSNGHTNILATSKQVYSMCQPFFKLKSHIEPALTNPPHFLRKSLSPPIRLRHRLGPFPFPPLELLKWTPLNLPTLPKVLLEMCPMIAVSEILIETLPHRRVLSWNYGGNLAFEGVPVQEHFDGVGDEL